MLSLRRYQRRALDAIAAAEAEGTRRPLVVHPTGTGKTVTFSHCIAERDALGRSLVFVHRDELAQQTREKLAMIAPELETGIVKAELDEVDARVVIASVQTLAREVRLERLVESAKRSAFGTIVVDEAHHAPAPTWSRALGALGSFNPYGPLTVGFTATPERDGKPLTVWEKVVDYMSIREAIYGDRKRKEDGGYLVPIQPAQTIETKMDLGKVGRTGGDYNEGDLGEELEGSGAIEQIADGILEHAKERKGVVFTPTVRTAELVAAALRRRGITAEALSGATHKDERRAILRRLKTGETQYVANCAVLTEGFDEPSISCVVVARPTKFHGLYVQMVGRGTRLYPGKEDLLILDVVGASTRHELITRVDLDDLPPEQRKKRTEPAEERTCGACDGPCQDKEAHSCRLCGRGLPAGLISEGATRHETCQHGRAEKIDVFGKSRLRWLVVEDSFCLGAGKGVLVMVPVGEDTWKLAMYEQAKITVLHEALPADWARGIGEDHAKAFLSLNERNKRWLSEPPTQSQLTRLQVEGLPAAKLPLVKTKGQAADLLTRIQARRAVRKLTSA